MKPAMENTNFPAREHHHLGALAYQHGVWDRTLLGDESQFQEKSPLKRKVALVVSNWRMEVLIIVLVVLDLVIIGLECALENNVWCIDGHLQPPTEASKAHHLHLWDKALEEIDYDPKSSKPVVGSDFKAAHARVAPNSSWTATLDAHGASMLQRSAKQDAPSVAYVLHEKNEDPHDRSAKKKRWNSPKRHKKHGTEQHSAHGSGIALICDGPGSHSRHIRAHNLHQWSIAILTIFLIELLAKAWSGWEHFINSKLHVLDLTVVAVSLAVDLSLSSLQEAVNQHATRMELGADILNFVLVAFRLWRVLRVMHGMFNAVHHVYEHEKEQNAKISEQEAELQQLRVELASSRGRWSS